MAITRKDIEHIAALARLDVSGDSFDRLAEDMQNIVGMVDQLQSLDLGDITDVINTEHKNALREDVPVQEYTAEELVKPNAPAFEAGGVVVPRVVE